jgi:long-chain fatty acid transport protein
MVKKIAAFAAIVAILGAISNRAHASGFALPEEDITAMGMANAFSAQADNPSANWYNPAALVWLEGNQVQIGEVFIDPQASHTYTQNGASKTDSSASVWRGQPDAYFSHKINADFAFGFGITAPFGLSTNWDTNSVASSEATYSNLKVLNYDLNGAYKVNDKLSVALGFDVATIDAWLYNMVPGTNNTIQAQITGNGKGVGFNAAVAYKATEDLNFAASYRSREKMSIYGTLTTLGALNSSGDADTSLTLPDMFTAGASYKATPKLRVNADFNYTGWSSYDDLDIHSNNAAFNQYILQGAATSIDQIRDWSNVCAIRLGGEYAVTDALKARIGWVYDATPLSGDRFEPRIPDSNRIGYAGGASYTVKAWTFNAAYMYMRMNDRLVGNSMGGGSTVDTNLDGDWSMYAHLIGIGASYKF